MADHQWHLDRRVPIALIFAIIVQSAGVTWWASQMNERMTQVERRLAGFAARNDATDERVNRQSSQIAVLTEQVSNTNKSLERVEIQLSNTNELLRELVRQRLPFRGNEQR